MRFGAGQVADQLVIAQKAGTMPVGQRRGPSSYVEAQQRAEHADRSAVLPEPGFSLPEQLFERLFNLHTGTLHDFDCRTCNAVTKHYSTTHSGLQDNVILKFLSRLLEDLSGLGNLIEGKPYVCTVCRAVRFE